MLHKFKFGEIVTLNLRTYGEKRATIQHFIAY